MKLFSGRGDEGKTDLLGEYRLEKTEPVFDSLGSLDEANEFLGLAKSAVRSDDISKNLTEIQHDLYKIMAEISYRREESTGPSFDPKRVAFLETLIAEFAPRFPELKGFITPGANELSSRFGCARVVVRRAERDLLRTLKFEDHHFQPIKQYLNRLSSLLFVLEVVAGTAPDIFGFDVSSQ